MKTQLWCRKWITFLIVILLSVEFDLICGIRRMQVMNEIHPGSETRQISPTLLAITTKYSFTVREWALLYQALLMSLWTK